jgi:hypothetical protein
VTSYYELSTHSFGHQIKDFWNYFQNSWRNLFWEHYCNVTWQHTKIYNFLRLFEYYYIFIKNPYTTKHMQRVYKYLIFCDPHGEWLFQYSMCEGFFSNEWEVLPPSCKASRSSTIILSIEASRFGPTNISFSPPTSVGWSTSYYCSNKQ